LDTDPAGPLPLSATDRALLRHDELRRTAPAVQHEVNNALMVLSSNLELLGRSATDGAPRRQLDRAQEAMRRLEATMRGFLDAARREAEEIVAICPAVALQQALPLLRVPLGARFGLDLDLPAAEVGAVRLDRARLDLALLSLAREAAARMAPGDRLRATVEARGTAEVALVVTLPEAAAPDARTVALLADAATATGGRLERSPGDIALVWPRAHG
jgi:signal transduction histidine kinase